MSETPSIVQLPWTILTQRFNGFCANTGVAEMHLSKQEKEDGTVYENPVKLTVASNVLFRVKTS